MEPREGSDGRPAADEWLLFIDGAARGNPGPSGAAAVLYDPSGARKGEGTFPLGHLTNNAAEYEALERGLELARESGARRLEVRSDSELLVRQMQGIYRVRSGHLKDAASRIRNLVTQFEAVRYTAIPREQNRDKAEQTDNSWRD